MQEQQEQDNQQCLEVVGILEKFKKKYEDAQSKIKAADKKLTMARAAVATTEEAKNKVAKEKEDLHNKL